MGDMPADPGGQRLILGPDGPDKPLAEDLRARCITDDQADPGGEHLLAGRPGLDVHAQVIVAALGAPGAGRVVARLWCRLSAPGGEVLDGRGDLLDEADRGMLRGP